MEDYFIREVFKEDGDGGFIFGRVEVVGDGLCLRVGLWIG